MPINIVKPFRYLDKFLHHLMPRTEIKRDIPRIVKDTDEVFQRYLSWYVPLLGPCRWRDQPSHPMGPLCSLFHADARPHGPRDTTSNQWTVDSGREIFSNDITPKDHKLRWRTCNVHVSKECPHKKSERLLETSHVDNLKLSSQEWYEPCCCMGWQDPHTSGDCLSCTERWQECSHRKPQSRADGQHVGRQQPEGGAHGKQPGLKTNMNIKI